MENFLKITPLEGGGAMLEVLKGTKLPSDSKCEGLKWIDEVLAKDGCIYYMPYNTECILRLHPNKSDSASMIGEQFELDSCRRIVQGTDDYIHIIPNQKGLMKRSN